jgi:hypothetical protein
VEAAEGEAVVEKDAAIADVQCVHGDAVLFSEGFTERHDLPRSGRTARGSRDAAGPA